MSEFGVVGPVSPPPNRVEGDGISITASRCWDAYICPDHGLVGADQAFPKSRDGIPTGEFFCGVEVDYGHEHCGRDLEQVVVCERPR